MKIEELKKKVKYYYYTDMDYYFITYKSKVIVVDEKDIVFSDITPEDYTNGSEKEITKEEFLEKTSKTNNKVKEYLEIIGV